MLSVFLGYYAETVAQKYDVCGSFREKAVAAKKKAVKKFSVTKAVKANARERVGQPPPERVIAEKPKAASRKAKYKETLSGILDAEPE
jgi:hypothetical protein